MSYKIVHRALKLCNVIIPEIVILRWMCGIKDILHVERNGLGVGVWPNVTDDGRNGKRKPKKKRYIRIIRSGNKRWNVDVGLCRFYANTDTLLLNCRLPLPLTHIPVPNVDNVPVLAETQEQRLTPTAYYTHHIAY